MAPARPQTLTAGQDPLSKFEGAIIVNTLPRPPNRQFEFHGLMYPKRGIYKKLTESGKRPPTHFHPYQWEFFRVLKGSLTVDLNGVPKHLTPGDREMVVRPYVHHVIYPTPGTETDEVEFVFSASDAPDTQAVLDQAFFENWYGYQEDVLQRGEKVDVIQVLAMFDAGDSYLSPPWWVPFRTLIGFWVGIVLGRWVGGFLGYAPFYPQWTTDWDAACDKMEQSWFHRRFAVRDAQEQVRKEMEKPDGKDDTL